MVRERPSLRGFRSRAEERKGVPIRFRSLSTPPPPFARPPPHPPPPLTSDPPTKELILSLNASKPQHLKFVIEDRLDDGHLLVDAKAAAEIRAFVRARGEEVAFQPPPREAAA